MARYEGVEVSGKDHLNDAPGLITHLEHIRWIAAFLVVIQHARGLVLLDYHAGLGLAPKLLYFATGFSRSSVIVFFVLSGYLVGGKAWKVASRGIWEARTRFFIDRLTRIFVVLLPTMLLTVAAALMISGTPLVTGSAWCEGMMDNLAARPITDWLITTFLLNEMTGKTIGYNPPLWSLAYEWTYYVVASAVVFAGGRRLTWPLAALFAYSILLLGLAVVNRIDILSLGLLWVAGAAATRYPLPRWRWAFLPFLVSIFIERFDSAHTLWSDYLVGAGTLCILSAGAPLLNRFPELGKKLAGFSFSLYAVHFPLMLLVIGLLQRNGRFLKRQEPSLGAISAMILLITVSYVGAYLFALVTEQRTDTWRRWIFSRSIRSNC